MDPFELAKKLYLKHDRSFFEDFDLHLSDPSASLVSTPNSFVLCRPINLYQEYKLNKGPFSTNHPDCLWIYVLTGSFKEDLLRILAKENYKHLPYIGWERNNKPRYYSTKKILAKMII